MKITPQCVAVATALILATTVSLAGTLIDTNGLDISFDNSGIPDSVKNSNGDELISANGGVYGFYVEEADHSIRRFDAVTDLGNDKYRFEISNSTEYFEAVFDGEDDYLTVRFTALGGFAHTGEQLRFQLANTLNQSVQVLPLDYMVDLAPTRDYVLLTRLSLWETSQMGGFALYEYVDDAQEDETLLDLWVDEGLPHPKVSGTWNRTTAEAWLDDWIDTAYDASFLNIFPESLADHDAFLPYAEQMDAKGIYLFNDVWRGEYLLHYRQNDEVNPDMYPNGFSDLNAFSSTVQSKGMHMMMHYLSGNIGEEDPDLTTTTVDPGVQSWGSATLAAAITASDTTIVIVPDAGVAMPIISSSSRPEEAPPVIPSFFDFKTFRVGGEWLTATAVIDLGNGTWRLDGVRRGLWNTSASAHVSGAGAKGYLRAYNADFVPDPSSTLFENLAKDWAALNNSLATNRSEFDGFEFHHATGIWAAEKYASIVYENLDHPTTSNTSGGRTPYAWLEYRFNRVKSALGGEFETREAVHMLLEEAGRSTPGIEDMEYELNVFLNTNNRGYSLAENNIVGMPLSTLTGHGQTPEVLELMKNWKHASLPMTENQRALMDTLRPYGKDRLSVNGNHNWGTALWRLNGSEFSKWYAFGTDQYTNEWHSGQEHGAITPRFYLKNGDSQSLDVPSTLSSGINASRVVGRVLPRFDVNASDNVDLMSYLSPGSSLIVSGSNTTGDDVWAVSNLAEYAINPTLDLSQNRGVGLWVTGDNSGATLIVRLTSGGSRDYVVPIDFSGKRWIELASSEQGWRTRNWGWANDARARINFEKISGIAIGFGHVPANTSASVTVEGVTAMEEINETLLAPTIQWGNQSVSIAASIDAGNHFILDADGYFTVYDERWNALSSESVGALLPSALSTFQIQSASSADIWLEVGVQGSNETAINPDTAPALIWSGGNSGSWSAASNWQGGVVPTLDDDVVIGSMASVSGALNDFASLIVKPGATLTFSENLYANTIFCQGVLDRSGGVMRLTNSTVELGSSASISSNVTWLDTLSGTLNFRDGASFGNAAMAFEHKGSNTIGFKLSNSGFETIHAGRLWDGNGATWSDVTYTVDITDYDMSSGGTIVLMDFASHQSAFDGTFNPTVNIVTGGSGLMASLAFDAVNSSLVLTVDYVTLDWDDGGVGLSWNTAGNWNEDRVPNLNDYVRVGGGAAVIDGQSEFWALDILAGSSVTFAEDLNENDILVQGTLDRSGGVLRLGGSKLYFEGILAPNVHWLDLSGGSIDFFDGALFGNVNLNFEHRGSITYGFELSSTGFLTLRGGKLWSAAGADWSDVTYNIDLSAYDIANGSTVELFKYSSHVAVYDAAFDPVVNIASGQSGLVGSLSFDTSHSQLLLTIGQIVEWDAGGSTSDWMDAANWDGDVVPSQEDHVAVGAGANVVNAQCEFTKLDILNGATVQLSENLNQNDILVEGTLDRAGVLRLAGSSISLKGGLGANITWLDLDDASVDFFDGASIGNSSMHFEHKGANAFGFKLSATGFQALNLGRLWSGYGATWADVSYTVDLSGYNIANGTSIVLMDFSSHVSTYDGSFNPTVTIVAGSSGLSGSLSFNTSTSQLVLTVW